MTIIFYSNYLIRAISYFNVDSIANRRIIDSNAFFCETKTIPLYLLRSCNSNEIFTYTQENLVKSGMKNKKKKKKRKLKLVKGICLVTRKL